MKIDWFKTLVFSTTIIIAGFFVGNMHKIGKQYDRTVQVKGLFTINDRDENTPQIKTIRVVSTIDFQLD